MKGYVNNPKATEEVLDQGWYLGLKDICFAMQNKHDGNLDYFWMSREASILNKGGTNYACEQIAIELRNFIIQHYELAEHSFGIAVIGLRIDSEHEDSCCVTLELADQKSKSKQAVLESSFVENARTKVSKGAKPDYLRIAKIVRNFKRSILVSELKNNYEKYLGKSK